MPNTLTTVETVVNVALSLVPQLSAFAGSASAAIDAGTELYKKLQGVFGSDILPDKTDAEVAALAGETWDELKVAIAQERARLDQSQTPPTP